MDWNDDGRKDLLTGEWYGNIRIYLNTNTDEDPVFSGYTFLQVNAATFDCGTDSAISVVDWNNDGLLDVLCGNNVGKVYLLINEGVPGSPLFNSSVFIQDGSADLTVDKYSTPDVADWNRDGKKDLIIGNFYGYLFYFENKGTDMSPVFNGSEKLKIGSNPINVGECSKVCAADWDNDEVTDILSGNSDGFLWLYRALGPLSLGANEIHDSTVDQIDLRLDAGAANGNRTYLVLAGMTGTEPGTPLPGGLATLPLNWDPLTDLVLSLVNSAFFTDFLGILDPDGRGLAQLTAPSNIGNVGLVIHFAYLLNDPFDYVSNPAPMEIVP